MAFGEQDPDGAADESRQAAGTTRVTVTLRPTDSERLDELAGSTRLSKNDVIRKALATEAFVQRTLQENRQIFVMDAKGNMRQVEFVT